MRRGVLAAVLCVMALAASHAGGQEVELPAVPPGMTLGELEDELRRREEDLARYQARLEDLESQNAAVGAELEARARELALHERQVRRQLVTLCRLSQGGYVLLLQDARSMADLFRRIQLARSLVDEDMEALRGHQRAVDALEVRRRELAGSLEAQRQLQEQVAQYRLELEAERERRVSAEAQAPAPAYDMGLGTADPFASGVAFDL